MLTVLVHCSVLPDSIEQFRSASVENSICSLKEPGVARFDVLQSEDDPSRFLLIEAYRTDDAPAAHKATKHYATWRDTVAPMMAEPRQGTRYRLITSGE